MLYSPESLVAFIEAAALGSFSAAARKLKKSQSSISVAVANLEADIGCQLFDRGGSKPILSEAGVQVLSKVQAIIEASDGLSALASRLSENIEPVLSIVMSDAVYPFFQTDILLRFEKEFPHTELQCGPAEGADVISLIQQEHANIGMLIAHEKHPSDIGVSKLGKLTELGVYVSRNHDLFNSQTVSREALASYRQLVLKTYASGSQGSQMRTWSAPDHLALLEFALQGFGWAELPKHLVERFGNNGLVELEVSGYPKRMDVDLVWSRRPALGPAAQWFINELQKSEL